MEGRELAKVVQLPVDAPLPVEGHEIGSTGSPPPKAKSPQTWLRDWLLVIGIPSTAVILASATYLRTSGASLPIILTSTEAELIAVTLVVLALLSVYGAKSFGEDAAAIVHTQREEMDQMRRSFREETTRLLDRNAEHWRSQTELLAGAANALNRVVELQTGALDLTKASIQLNQELLQLERERERFRLAEADVERKRLQPQLGLRLQVPQTTLIKQMNVNVHNRGMDGRNLVVFFGVQPTQVMQWMSKGIDPQQVLPINFGDIAQWPADAHLTLTCEVSDTLGHRYRFVSHFEYHRNRAALVSVPTVDPDDWIYPDPQRL